MGRDLRESLRKGAEVLLSWIKFGNLSLCCLLKEWRLAAGVLLCRVLLKVGKMEEGSLS